MATAKRRKAEAGRAASRILFSATQLVYALPYYTRNGGDTEYLISNPGAALVAPTLGVFGKDCRLVRKVEFKLGPNCTRSFRLRALVPDHVGLCVLQSPAELVVHLLYYRAGDLALVAAAQAGRDNVVAWREGERTRTYGFGYRALPLGHDSLGGAVFVSNPAGATLAGDVAFFDQDCKENSRKRFRIPPGCTAEFPFPVGRYGYGTVTVSGPAAINVLHYAASAKGLASAELIGEGDRLV
jgi:hypothetical protein